MFCNSSKPSKAKNWLPIYQNGDQRQPDNHYCRALRGFPSIKTQPSNRHLPCRSALVHDWLPAQEVSSGAQRFSKYFRRSFLDEIFFQDHHYHIVVNAYQHLHFLMSLSNHFIFSQTHIIYTPVIKTNTATLKAKCIWLPHGRKKSWEFTLQGSIQ